MSIQFDWQVGFDQEEETLAHIGRRQRRRWPWWRWAILSVLLVAIAAGGYLVLRRRYREAQERLKFQIQSVIDLEARAYAQRDRSLFMEQQDRGASSWFRAQATRFRQDCDAAMPGGTIFLPEEYDDDPSIERCRPVLPAKVDAIDLRGDVAWVEVIEDDPPVRRTRFYRQTDLGWKHTAPRIAFWGAPIQLTDGDLVFRYHRRDQPYVDPLVEHLSATFAETCAELGCPAQRQLEINFAVQDTPSPFGHQQGRTLVLPSPWLSGIPVGGEWDRETMESLTYAVTYNVASQLLRSRTGGSLNRLQAALIDEYAIWHATGDATRAPIIGRLVERYGTEGLPEILSSLADNDTLSLVLAGWLDISATREPVMYFQTLLDLEREAMRAGRRRTFLLLQDDSPDWWIARRENLFKLAQSDALPLQPARVQTVGISADLARVTVENADSAPAGAVPQDDEQTVFFRRRNGDWKRSAPPQEQTREISVAVSHVTTQVIAESAWYTTVSPPHAHDQEP